MIIVGLNAFHADSSAAIIRDGVLVAAAEEERFRRVKHWAGFPSQSIAYCLREAKLTVDDVDHIAVNQDSRANLLRKIGYLVTKGADLGGLSGADAYCQSLAQAAGAGSRTWRAYLSTSAIGGAAAVNARDRIGSGPWQNVKGQVIAKVGHSGLATGDHLYFEVLVGNQRVNPVSARLNTRERLQGPELARFRAFVRQIHILVGEAK